MRVQAFIASGILEKYALGMTNEEENREILEMASQHLEIKEELAEIRKTMEHYILSHQVMPPSSLKDSILSLSATPVAAPAAKNGRPPTVKPPAYRPEAMQKKATPRKINLSTVAIALLVLALAGACFVAFAFFQKAQRAEAAIATAQAETNNLQKELESQQQLTSDIESKLAFYTDPDNQAIALEGTSKAPDSKATVYWNKSNRTGYLHVTALPPVENGGIPVLWNAGTVRSVKLGILKANQPGELVPIEFMDDARLFYVTEEESADVERPDRSRILMRGH